MPEDVDIFIDAKDQYSDRRDQIPYEKRIKELEDRVLFLEKEMVTMKIPKSCNCISCDDLPDGGG